MKNDYQLPPVFASTLKPLSPLKKIERIKISRIQNPSYDNLSKIRDFSTKALDSFFNQRTISQRLETTYAKPHYFTHTKQIAHPSHPFLIQERVKEKTTSVISPKLLFGARQFKQYGTLKQTSDGLVYLQVSDDYIHKLHPFLALDGAQKPFYCAHIPVISEKELSTLSADQIKELGESFNFSVKDCQRINLEQHPDVESMWVLNIESPSLEHLRERYGLSSRLHSQDFTIVIGTKLKEITIQPKKQDSYYFKVNPATCYA